MNSAGQVAGRCCTPACAPARPTRSGPAALHRRGGGRVRRAGAAGEIVMQFDSGFWSNDTSAFPRREVSSRTFSWRGWLGGELAR